jgi:predicted metal-dependent hydrolase
MADPRFHEAVACFNNGAWYDAHDLFEELWHESSGMMRPLLQGILQLAVAQLHHQRGNRRGATILTGEGLGRLRRCPDQALGLDLLALRNQASHWLQLLQAEQFSDCLPPPQLRPASGGSPA